MTKFSEVFGRLSIAVFAFALSIGLVGPIGKIDNIRYPLLAAVVLYVLASLILKAPWRKDAFESLLSHRNFSLCLFITAAALYVRIKFLQLPAGQISGVDFSHIDYAIWSTAHGRFMQIPIIPPQATFTDFFGNHYSPVLFFHVLARFVVDSPFSSLFVHALSLAAAIPVLHALARKLVDKVTAAFLTLNYALCGAVASTLQFDIHQESFFPLAFGLIFLGIYSRPIFLWIGALLAFSIKEDAGVYLFPAFLLMAILFSSRRKSCLALAVVSVLYTALVLKVLMPMHQPAAASAPYYLPMWAKYGSSFSEVATSMLQKPHWVAWDLFSNKDLYKNLLSWAFLPVLSPLGLMAATPLVVSSTASGVQRGLGLYYGIVLVPIFFYASAHALSRFRHRRRIAAIMLILGAFVGGSYLRFPAPRPFLPEIENAAARLSFFSPSEIVYVQSGLLPFLSYSEQWRRLDSFSNLPPPGSASVVLFEGLEQSSLRGDQSTFDESLRKLGYRLEEKSGRLRWYR